MSADEFEHARVDANGITIHTVSIGEGPLVVFCHGFPESWYSWRHQLPAVAAAGFRAVALDMRGTRDQRAIGDRGVLTEPSGGRCGGRRQRPRRPSRPSWSDTTGVPPSPGTAR